MREAEKLPNGVCNEDLVHFGEWPCTINVREADEILENFPFWERFEEQNKRRSRMVCRAIKDGCTYPGKGIIQPGLRLVLSGNFFLALNRSHHFLLKKVRI